jgi:hypothetical protein
MPAVLETSIDRFQGHSATGAHDAHSIFNRRRGNDSLNRENAEVAAQTLGQAATATQSDRSDLTSTYRVSTRRESYRVPPFFINYELVRYSPGTCGCLCCRPRLLTRSTKGRPRPDMGVAGLLRRRGSFALSGTARRKAGSLRCIPDRDHDVSQALRRVRGMWGTPNTRASIRMWHTSPMGSGLSCAKSRAECLWFETSGV